MLTDSAIRSLKAPAKPLKLTDGLGLHLLVSTSGSRLWRLAYRFGGKQKQLALGAYPDISLAKARERRDEARRLIAEGIDPSVRKRLDKIATKAKHSNTFRIYADQLLDKKRRSDRAPATLDKTAWLLDFANAGLGDRPIADITAPEILAVLRKVEARGRLETARRLRAVISEVFRLAIVESAATTDPTFGLRGALVSPKVKHRAAIIEPKALGALLRAIDGYDGQETTHAALRLMPVLFPRPGELRLAEWSEFDFEGARWTIPAARMKMRRDHQVPLPRQAIAILEDLRKLTGYGKLVFPGYGRGSRAGKPVEPRPISENTMNAALRRLGYGPDEVTSHGFRATASTLLNESGKWSSDAIERALAHEESDDVRRAYARGQHWAERVQMAQWWADYLDTLKTGATILRLPAGSVP